MKDCAANFADLGESLMDDRLTTGDPATWPTWYLQQALLGIRDAGRDWTDDQVLRYWNAVIVARPESTTDQPGDDVIDEIVVATRDRDW